ncbi:NADPH-dependent FMN reductase [Sinomicrobium sp. M5D2P17]
MKITIVIGSVRSERHSHRLAHFIGQQLSAKGAETDIIDLSITPLPVYGVNGPEAVHIAPIGRKLEQSDALILVTPEYHGSFSGALKNMLDYYWAEFQKKPIGVATASSGKMGGINASSQLQHVILSLGAYALPLKLLVPEIHHAFDDTNSPVQESVTGNTEKFLNEFLWYTDAIYHKKVRESYNVVSID